MLDDWFEGPAQADPAARVDTLRAAVLAALALYAAAAVPLLPRPLRPYQAPLRAFFQPVLRQPYRAESARLTEIAAEPPLPAENIVPHAPSTYPRVGWETGITYLALLVTPRRDSLLNVVVTRVQDDGRRRYPSDSSYCFWLRRGQLRFFSARPRHRAALAFTLKKRLDAATRHYSRLATRARAVLGRPCPWRDQLLAQVRFTPQGLFIRYACVTDEQVAHPAWLAVRPSARLGAPPPGPVLADHLPAYRLVAKPPVRWPPPA